MLVVAHSPKLKRFIRRYRWRVILFSVLWGGILWFSGVLWLSDHPVTRTALASDEQLNHFPEPLYLTSRILIGGDVFWGRRIQIASANDPLGSAFPFSGLDTLNRADYDNWIANLECPSTDTEVPMSDQENLLRFNCQPQFLDQFAKWFNVVSLANNHTDNVYGQSGLDETRTNLDKHGIQYFGHYDNAVTDDLCEVVEVHSRIIYDNGLVEPTTMPLALCGYHGVFKIPLDSEIAMLNRYAQVLPTIVLPHAGAEYRPASDTLRENIYRSMVDYGADLIAGGHPHWVQNTESYQGKLIAYSMGNLIFDQQFNADVTRSLMLDVTLTMTFDSNVQKWIALAPNCDTFQDDCLSSAVTQGLEKPQINFSYGMVATQNDGYVARLASEAVAAAVAERANWSATMSALGL